MPDRKMVITRRGRLEMMMLIKVKRKILGPFAEVLRELTPASLAEMRRYLRNGHYELRAGGVDFYRARFGWHGWGDGWIVGPNGERLCHDRQHNLLATEGANKVLDDGLNGATYYLGVYSGAVDPATTWTGSNVVANSTEATNYNEATRPAWTDAAATGGSKASSAPSVFTATTAMTINGGLLISVNTKGVAGGVLINAVRRASAASVAAADTYNLSWTVTLSDS